MSQVCPYSGSSIGFETAVLLSLNKRVKSFCVCTLLAGNTHCCSLMMGRVWCLDLTRYPYAFENCLAVPDIRF